MHGNRHFILLIQIILVSCLFYVNSLYSEEQHSKNPGILPPNPPPIAGSVTIQKSGIQFSQAETNWLTANPIVPIYFEAQDIPPYSFHGANGDMAGVFPDVIAGIEERLGIQLEYKLLPSGQISNGNLHEIENMFIMGSDRRLDLKHHSRSPAFLNSHEALFVKKDIANQRLRFSDLTVATVKGRTPESVTDGTHFPKKVIFVENPMEGLKLVVNDDVDGFWDAYGIGSYYISSNYLVDMQPIHMNPENITVHFFVSRHSPELASVVNKALEDMQQTELPIILKKWYVWLEKTNPRINLTEVEQKWLADHPNITLGFTDSFPPALIKESNGELSGYMIEFLNILNQRLGTNLNLEIDNWKTVQEEIRKKSIDGILAISQRGASNNDILTTDAYFNLPLTIFARNDAKFKIDRLEDLRGKTVAVLEGFAYADHLLEPYSGQFKRITTQSSLEGLQLVFQGKADVMIGLSHDNYLISRYSLSGVNPVYAEWNNMLKIVTGIRADWPELVSILNKGIATFSTDELNSLLAKWIQLPSSVRPPLNLTEAERDWLEAHPVIRVGSDPTWAPIEYLDSKNGFNGIAIDYIKHIESLLGIRFKFAEGYTWSELMKMGKTKDIDMFSGITKTRERSEFLQFTEPHLSYPIVTFTRQDVTYIPNLQALEGKRVAVVNGYAIQEYLARDFPEIELIPTVSNQEALARLERGDVFAFVGNLNTVSYYIANQGYQAVKVSGETPYSNDLSIGVRDDWPMLTQILQKALNNISAADRNEISQRWASVKYEHSFDYLTVLKFILPALLIIMLIVYWNRRLQKEINTRKLAEIAFKKAKEDAEAANRAKSTFLSNMSHELRTPLNAIMGYAQLLQRDKGLTEKQYERMAIIHKSGQHLLQLINDVLEVSKIESGSAVLNQTDFDLYELLKMLESVFSLRANDKNLDLTFTRTPDVPRFIYTDQLKLRQVLFNLISNAVKFTHEGSINVRTISEPQAGTKNRIVFSVEDTGPGIPPEEIDNLFITFGQTKAGLKSEEGTGLGLAISQKFVQLMGGKIKVNSELGTGSSFTFTISVKSVVPEQIQPEEDFRRVLKLQPGQESIRILIVDDHTESRQMLKSLLEKIGFDVSEAENGAIGLQLNDTWRPHLIFMDMRMPVMDGYKATRAIKSSKGHKPPIIAFTASAFEEERLTVLSAGCDSFIRKPINEPEVFNSIVETLDVKFIYEDQSDIEVAIDSNNKDISDASIKDLPDDLLRKLDRAAVELNQKAFEEIFEELRTQGFGSIAKTMETYIEEFRFDKIRKMLES